MKTPLAFAIVGLLLAVSPAAAQVTWVVDDDGLGSAASCDAASPALTTPAAGIAAAANGDTVLVCPGTYVGNVDFDGKAITLRSAGGPGATILDANGSGSVVTFASGEGRGSVLEGFTIRNGHAPSAGGGGITIAFASPVIRGNVVVDNQSDDGGGIDSDTGSPWIEGNTIARNSSRSFGGGVAIWHAGAAVIRRNVISDNAAGVHGGGLLLFSAGAPVVDLNIVSGNAATYGGGISMLNQSDAAITGNAIVNNRASREGGGIAWQVPLGDRGPWVVNNTIAGNESPVGAGVYAGGFDAGALLSNNVIAAGAGQPAVTCGSQFDTDPPLFRANNIYTAGGPAYGGACSDQTGVNGNISAQPLFVDPAAGDYHLQPGSPGVDAGDNAAPGLPATDLDGDARVLDGDDNGTAVVDMGADEAGPAGQGTPPGAFGKASPGNLAQQVATTTEITWASSPGATGYEYCFDTVDNGACDAGWIPTGSVTGAAMTGLSPLTTYYWQARARNAAGTTYADGGSSAWWRLTTLLMAPLSFGKIDPPDAQGGVASYVLSWAAAPAATGYEYCYDTVYNATCDGSWISAGSATSATVASLAPWVPHYWQVRAVNSAGTTYANGGAWWFFVPARLAPAAFWPESPADGAGNLPTTTSLAWSDSPLATSYRYCYDTLDNESCDDGWIDAGIGTSVTITGLQRATTYYWMVQAVNDTGVTSANRNGISWAFATAGKPLLYNFSGGDRSDIAVWRPSSGTFYWKTAGSGYTGWHSKRFGPLSAADRPVPADYDGDLRADMGVWRAAAGTWNVRLTSDPALPLFTAQWGKAGDRPVPGDYDGDGNADPAVWRPSNGTWYVLLSGAGHTRSWAIRWGVATDVPVPADFDGDGRVDVAVWRPGSGVWYVLTSMSNYEESLSLQWGVGAKGDVPVAGDYDGDGKADLAVWRPGNGTWYVRRSDTSYATSFSVQWGVGAAGDVPVVADFDGDARTDIAVWRPGSGTWYVKPSGSSYAASFAVQWGARGDTPMGGATR